VTELVPSVGWAVAFGAGVLSFFSPCTAPLVPGYVSLIAGVSGDRLAIGEHAPTRRALAVSLLFVLGFVLVFVLLGAVAALLGGLVGPARRLVNQVAGGVMIAMGLVVLGVVRVPALYQDRRLDLAGRALGPVGPTLLGMAFAFGWTPCVGPILAAILFYAGTATTVGEGALLLLLYALGMGLPFVLAGVGVTRLVGVAGWARRHSRLLTRTSGAVLIAMGLLFLTNRFFWVSIAVQRLYYTFFS
jgi:cytochrome c-type biogenesis protein